MYCGFIYVRLARLLYAMNKRTPRIASTRILSTPSSQYLLLVVNIRNRYQACIGLLLPT